YGADVERTEPRRTAPGGVGSPWPGASTRPVDLAAPRQRARRAPRSVRPRLAREGEHDTQAGARSPARRRERHGTRRRRWRWGRRWWWWWWWRRFRRRGRAGCGSRAPRTWRHLERS